MEKDSPFFKAKKSAFFIDFKKERVEKYISKTNRLAFRFFMPLYLFVIEVIQGRGKEKKKRAPKRVPILDINISYVIFLKTLFFQNLFKTFFG